MTDREKSDNWSADFPREESTPYKHTDKRNTNIPKPLELRNMEPSRDSGYFADSPLSGTSSAGKSSASSKRFQFGASTSRFESDRGDSADLNESSSDDEEVFHMSLDQGDDCVFTDTADTINNPFHSQRAAATAAADVEVTQAQAVGNSLFYVPRDSSSSETAQGNDGDSDSSSDEEFSTAEYSFQPSNPITIPSAARQVAVDQEPAGRSLPANLDGIEYVPQPAAPVNRIHTSAIQTIRPHSGDGRMQGVAQVERQRIQSTQAVSGPLPDVVSTTLRGRAYSESAIHTATVVGTRLRRISDEFSNISIARRLSLNLIQQMQIDREHGGQATSCPEPRQRPRTGLGTVKELLQ